MSRRILLIDDHVMIHRLIPRLLGGDEVVARGSALDALGLLRAGERFDVILCDLNMPEMGGMEFHRELSSMDPSAAARTLFLTGGPLAARSNTASYYATDGIGPDLMEAARNAIRHMIDYLQRTYGLTRPDAYMLCSVMVDLKICEIVDAPHWVISAFLPQSIFVK